MLIASTSAVLLVDAPPSQGINLSPHLVSSSRRMLDAASLATVPTIVALYPTATPPGVIAMSVNLDGDARAFPFDPSPADWPSSPLGAALAATGRNRVVGLGLLLQELASLSVVAKVAQLDQEDERREELIRRCMRALGRRLDGESESEAEDRFKQGDSVERHEVLVAAAEREKRQREIRDAMAKKAAEEAVPKVGRE